jgi:integrase
MSAEITKPCWKWPLNLAQYDRNPELTAQEKEVLHNFMHRRETAHKRARWFAQIKQAIPRLIIPLCDVCDFLNHPPSRRTPLVAAFLQKMHQDQVSYWALSDAQWTAFFQGDQARTFITRNSVSRYACLSILYLLGLLSDCRWAKQLPHAMLAQQVFGEAVFQAALGRVSQALHAQGFSEFCATGAYLPLMLGFLFLNQRCPHLEELSSPYLQEMYDTTTSLNHRAAIHRLAYALFVLQIIPHPIAQYETPPYVSQPGMSDGIHLDWVAWCQRWRETTTYQPDTARAYYRTLLQVGRWLAVKHPQVTSPTDWTQELAIEYIAMVDDMCVGDWTYAYQSANMGKPLSPATKMSFISVVRTFLRNCQEWGWVKLQLNPAHCLAVPRAILAKIGPAPRVIADDIWAKIMWAGLNLTADDLLFETARAGEGPAYPIEMVRAVAVTWLFSGLRMNEIRRLRVGCIRRQEQSETGQIVCLLTVPVNKTSSEYSKPVDTVIGQAFAAWEQVRPVAPPMRDRKTGEKVSLLFTYRDVPLGRQFINETLIPTLCSKAGIALADARGRITSHRARATIATQLYNAKEGMSLTELQAWLGHRVPGSTQHYVAVTPLKQAEAYAAAGYLTHNKRLIEVLIDQEAIRQGQTQAGEPWRYYDVGHGHCHYDFFDECPHRLACARCDFYVPKQSSRGQYLEAKNNLERMLQEIQLSEPEQAAVADGVLVMTKLLAQLADVPTPAGPTPRQIAMSEGWLVAEEKQA